MMFFRLIPGLWLLQLVLAPVAAFAGGGNEDDHQLSMAGGIAAPACTTAPFQNPAGLIYNSSFKLTGQAGAGEDFHDPLLRGGALGGNGSFGAGAGLDHQFNTEGTNRTRARDSGNGGDGSTGAWYGLALDPGLNASFGLAGRTELSPGSGSQFNAGTLIHPNDKLRVGATAIGLNDGVDEWGLGLAAEPVSGLSFVLDSSADNKSSHVAVQPAVAVGSKAAALTVGYGFNGGSRQLSDGFSAGGSVKAGSNTSVQVYYNQLSTFYMGVSFGF